MPSATTRTGCRQSIMAAAIELPRMPQHTLTSSHRFFKGAECIINLANRAEIGHGFGGLSFNTTQVRGAITCLAKETVSGS